MDNQTLWKLMQETVRLIRSIYTPMFIEFCEETGIDQPSFGVLLAALIFEPEAITPDRLRVRIPYTAADAYLERLEALEKRGELKAVNQRKYRLTISGRETLWLLLEKGRSAMAEADPLPLTDSRRLAILHNKVVRACSEATQSSFAPLHPSGSMWSIGYALKLLPPLEPPLPFTEEAISCLNAFRDDAHLAAWQHTGLSALAFEALSLLWRGEADSLEAIYQELKWRGHHVGEYADALVELRNRTFIEGVEFDLALTPIGRSFREQVERDTDRFFFGPWEFMERAMKSEMAALLQRLREALAVAV